MDKSLRIVFMGTPEFAVASLDALVKSRHKVIAVVTAPDRPTGRGLKLQESDVKKRAVELGIPVLQPDKLKDENFLNELKELNADLFVVVAFRMLPEVVWKMPPLGTINLHASELPKYRGAAPINWAIINGESLTGTTTFFINEVIDKGNVLMRKQRSIGENDNAGSLHDNLMKDGAGLLVQTVDAIAEGNYSKGTTQDKMEMDYSLDDLKPAPKIFKEDCKINWNKPAEQVRNFIRGLSPYPAAWTVLQNNEGKKLTLKIYGSIVKSDIHLSPGEMRVENSIHIYIGCADAALEITELQLEGRKTMPVADFLRGFRMEEEGWAIVEGIK